MHYKQDKKAIKVINCIYNFSAHVHITPEQVPAEWDEEVDVQMIPEQMPAEWDEQYYIDYENLGEAEMVYFPAY